MDLRTLLRRTPAVVTQALVVLAVAMAILWLIPANYYFISPGQAQPVASMISVRGHRYVPSSGGLYDTYVDEFQATRLLYVLFGLAMSDVSIEPASAVSDGCPNQQYEQQLMQMMSDSKIEAEAAALHASGYKVEMATSGPQVDQVDCNFPAARLLHPGDRILAIDGHPVRTFNQVRSQTRAHRPGSVLVLKILRDGRVRQTSVPTVRADDNGDIVASGGHAMLGIVMSMPFKFPVNVHIDSGDVGGPSAGLAFALGIVQQLTRRDLTNGNKVAVTGTITTTILTGPHHRQIVADLVGPIGGAKQKAIAAQSAGAKYFLVPTANYAEALSAHANLKVIPVDSLEQALAVLHSLPRPGRPASKLSVAGPSQ